MAERNYEPLSVRLQKDEDKDIIEFLEDKPKAYIVKLALRRFMNDSRDVLSEVPTEVTERGKSTDSDDYDPLADLDAGPVD